MGKIRRVTFKNMTHSGNIRIRRSIDLRELEDFGSITDQPQDLPTSGAAHRADTGGSTSATRNYTDLRSIDTTQDVVVDVQDLGILGDTAYDWSKHVYSGGPDGPALSGWRGDTSTWGSGAGGMSSSTGSSVSSIDQATGTQGWNLTGYARYSEWNTFNADGTKWYVEGKESNTKRIIQTWTLSTPWDLTTATFSGSTNMYPGSSYLTGSAQWVNNDNYFISNAGGKLVLFDRSSNVGNLPTTLNVSNPISNSYSTTFDTFFFTPDGTKMFATASSGRISEYGLTTAWDLRTMSLTTTYDSAGTDHASTTYKGIVLNSTGTKLYVGYDHNSDVDDGIYEFDLSTAYDLSTISYNGKYLSTKSIAGFNSAYQLSISDDDTTIFFTGMVNATTHEVWAFELPVVAASSSTEVTVPDAEYVGPALAADYALDFTGTDNYLSVAQSDATGWFSNATGWSVDLWFKHRTSMASNDDGIMGQHGNFMLLNGGGGSAVSWTGAISSSGNYNLTSTTTISDTDWHHVHVGYDGTTVRLFLDGQLESSINTTVYDGGTSGDLTIGTRTSGNGLTLYGWDGYLADIHITSGSSAHARTSTFDPDNLYAPTANDETVLLVYGTYDDIVNATDVTVTEEGSGSTIGHNVVQPWVGYGTSSITHSATYKWTMSQVAGDNNATPPAGYLFMPRGPVFNNDGTLLYYVSGGAYNNTAMLYAMSLATPYDISSVTDPDYMIANLNGDDELGGPIYTNPENSHGRANNMQNVFFNPEGTKMWTHDKNYGVKAEYILTTPWDITDSSRVLVKRYVGNIPNGATFESGWETSFSAGQWGLSTEWSNDGLKFYTSLLGYNGVYENTLTTPYDIFGSFDSTTSKNMISSALQSEDLGFSFGGAFNHNGTERYYLNASHNYANTEGRAYLSKFTLSTPYDISTMAYDSKIQITDIPGAPGGISISGAPVFSPNGRKMYVMAYNTWTNNGDGTYTSDAFYQNFVVIEYNIG